jgi:hypothetical protein
VCALLQKYRLNVRLPGDSGDMASGPDNSSNGGVLGGSANIGGGSGGLGGGNGGGGGGDGQHTRRRRRGRSQAQSSSRRRSSRQRKRRSRRAAPLLPSSLAWLPSLLDTCCFQTAAFAPCMQSLSCRPCQGVCGLTMRTHGGALGKYGGSGVA